jgi:dynamin 1-like protein
MASLGDDLLKVVNKLQDLVFNTIGNDSLDLPQIVSFKEYYAADIFC